MVDAKYEEGQAKLLPIDSPACEYKFYLQMAKVLFQFPPIINYLSPIQNSHGEGGTYFWTPRF